MNETDKAKIPFISEAQRVVLRHFAESKLDVAQYRARYELAGAVLLKMLDRPSKTKLVTYD